MSHSIPDPLVNTTGQMGVISGPKGGMGLAMLLDNIREVGAGDCMYQVTEMIQSLYHLSTRTVVHSIWIVRLFSLFI